MQIIRTLTAKSQYRPKVTLNSSIESISRGIDSITLNTYNDLGERIQIILTNDELQWISEGA